MATKDSKKRVLKMSFTDDGGRKATLSIPEPKEEITAETVKGVADLIIEKKAMNSRNGILTSYEGAKIVTTITEELE